jgi:hypothetical protein
MGGCDDGCIDNLKPQCYYFAGSDIMAVDNLLRIVEMNMPFSAYEEYLRSAKLYFEYLEGSTDTDLSADERTALVKLADSASLAERPKKFLEQSDELVRFTLARQGDAIQRAYEKFLASDYPSVAREGFREQVEKSGGIRPPLEGIIERAKGSLTRTQGLFQQDLGEINQGRRPIHPVDIHRGPSDDALFEGGVAAIGIGIATVAAAAALPATAIASGLATIGGVMMGAGGTFLYESFTGKRVHGDELPPG